MKSNRNILVTSALPYANAPLHIGHFVEYTQTDIWVRYHRINGHSCTYICASDAHGTPTMLKAEEEGITPEKLVEKNSSSHLNDFKTYRISVDNYVTTHVPENKEITEEIYNKLKKNNHIYKKNIKQSFDDKKKMFLPDRYVKGTCPSCGAKDQYGDSCEVCGSTYSPMQLIDPISVISGTKPTVKGSEHIFFKLSEFEDELKLWISKNMDITLVNKLEEWFKQGLKDWDISRDSPYFGFPIPEEKNKYFYVWFDAPIGYIGSYLNFTNNQKDEEFYNFWQSGDNTELYHFIGKDIVYFHTLFWPAVLSGAGYRKPTAVFVHGFLTINGKKMSKSKGTFINASIFAKYFDPDFLRYYFAAKLGPTPDDLDLNIDDFIARINSDLVGKLINIASRSSGFIHKFNDGLLADKLINRKIVDVFLKKANQIEKNYVERNYAQAIREIIDLADQANQYIDEEKPWFLAKDPEFQKKAVEVSTVAINLFRILILYLKPVIPGIAERCESFLNVESMAWSDKDKLLIGSKLNNYKNIIDRVEKAHAIKMIEESKI
ncbi:MAG: methionine--tRNA ligase [Gammaproteobacteria bacterium TMED78]|nr:MAG: methionine--tRNA ligase [Gammaproteobacteria bacterium TMED78]